MEPSIGTKIIEAAPAVKKGGKVLISLQVSVKKAENVREVCLQIQEKVATAVSMMSEAVPFGVEVKVVSVI